MRLRPALAAAAAFLTLSCGASDSADSQRDWQHVLNTKKAALASTASPREKQLYADTLSAFVREHPGHSRAGAVYRTIQLDFARELASLGRYQDSIRFYRAVLAHDPTNPEATRGVAEALDRLAVSRQKLLALQKGMTEHQVAQILGKPAPGWRVKNERDDATMESWYYRTVEGGIAGVYFRDGSLFAAEASSNAKLTSLTR